MPECQHCGAEVEPVDNANATKYRFRHAKSKRISCWDVYRPEIATPAEVTAG